ncbi:MAG: WG repeat-containing protein [Oscillospiraceae bacterium]|jgi:hypothetical protein|nr:WG repeat-containing protein [Oscillospiraceae bacterium]
MKIFTSVIIILLIGLGWFGYVNSNKSGEDGYKNTLTNAVNYMEHGLYQLAIEEYDSAIKLKDTIEAREGLIDAYEKRLTEDDSLVYDFQDVLAEYVELYGYNNRYTIRLAELYEENNDEEEAYEMLKNAVSAGADGYNIEEKLTAVKYGFKIGSANYTSFLPESNGSYSVYNGYSWSRIDDSGSILESERSEYSGQSSKDGITLFTNDKDSRLIDKDGVVRGIFKEQITQAGIYSEGLIGIMKDSKWSYYNNFAEKQFGDYEFGGSFINGKVAVKDGDKWYIVNNKGERQGDKEFDDLHLTQNQEYILNDVIIASENNKYHIYNDKFKQVGEFGCDNIDINTKDGIIAFKQGSKWGFVNTSGKIITESMYEDAKSFSNGLAAVCKDGKWGFIDKDNEMVIEPQFSDADYFTSSGTCMVRTPLPDTDGNYFWQLLRLNIKLKN